MNQNKAGLNWSFTLPWLIYLLSIVTLFSIYVIDYDAINIKVGQVLVVYNLLLTGCILTALASSLPRNIAIIYTFYWVGLGILFEYLYISNGLLVHHNRSTFIWGEIPLMIVFHWLTLFFIIYTCSTFIFLAIKKIRDNNSLVTKLILDAIVMLILIFLFEPIGEGLEYWSWKRPNYILLFKTPIIVYVEHFLGIVLAMLPIRILEAYKIKLDTRIYFKWFNLPIFIASFFLLLGVLFADAAGLMIIKWFGSICLISFLMLVFFQTKKEKRSS